MGQITFSSQTGIIKISESLLVQILTPCRPACVLTLIVCYECNWFGSPSALSLVSQLNASSDDPRYIQIYYYEVGESSVPYKTLSNWWRGEEDEWRDNPCLIWWFVLPFQVLNLFWWGCGFESFSVRDCIALLDAGWLIRYIANFFQKYYIPHLSFLILSVFDRLC
jgi:hypothetical protein